MDTSSAQPKLVLFYRDFQRFSGGHLKVWNYFNHVIASDLYAPRIAFSPTSRWDASNPWLDAREYVVEWQPEIANALFIAGKDWKVVPDNFSKPIINLIQHPRHAEPEGELFRFLSRPAIRICVSQQVADAINQTGRINGPVVVIPNGIDLTDFPRAADHERPIDVLICGLKAPDLAREIEHQFQNDENVTVTPLLEWMPRQEYLTQLRQAKVVITLPRKSEGFYLPALEAMASDAIVVCPDCVGNRDFCRDGVNCFRPPYDAGELVGATYRALTLSPDAVNRMKEEARATVNEHSLEGERKKFLDTLRHLDQLW